MAQQTLIFSTEGCYANDLGGFDNALNWLSAGERTDVQTQREVMFATPATPALNAELIAASFSAALLTLTGRFNDAGTPCTLRLRGVGGNPATPTSYAQFQAVEANLTSAFVDYTQPAWTGDATSGQEYTLPDLSAVMAELAAWPGRTNAWRWGLHITANGIVVGGSHISRTHHFRGAPAALLPRLALTYEAGDPGTVPIITGVSPSDVAAAGTAVVITGDRFTGADA